MPLDGDGAKKPRLELPLLANPTTEEAASSTKMAPSDAEEAALPPADAYPMTATPPDASADAGGPSSESTLDDLCSKSNDSEEAQQWQEGVQKRRIVCSCRDGSGHLGSRPRPHHRNAQCYESYGSNHDKSGWESRGDENWDAELPRCFMVE
jgi:hypothetical protein